MATFRPDGYQPSLPGSNDPGPFILDHMPVLLLSQQDNPLAKRLSTFCTSVPDGLGRSYIAFGGLHVGMMLALEYPDLAREVIEGLGTVPLLGGEDLNKACRASIERMLAER